MLRTELAGRETSRIGLGCARLQGGAGGRAGTALVEQARALGITHFDVAPAYSLGLAEDVLGDALAGDGGVTIATKVGIARPSNPGLKALAWRVARPLLAATPALKQTLARRTQGSAARNQFAPEQIESSVVESLRRLRRDSVDALLLHQPEPGSIGPATEQAMRRELEEGRARALGSGTGGDLAALVPFGTVRQYRWSPGNAPAPGGTDIVHGLLRRYPRPSSPASAWSEGMRATGFDPADPDAWPGLLLTLALAEAPGRIVLVSANDPARLTRAVGAIDWTAANGGRPGFVVTARTVVEAIHSDAPDRLAHAGLPG